MLAFWVDPESAYFKQTFAGGKQLVFYCASAWRSALATKAVQEMGLSPVAHLEAGFSAWKKACLPLVPQRQRERCALRRGPEVDPGE